MKKSMKRLLSLLCSFMLIVSALPVFTAFAEGGTKAEGKMGIPSDQIDETDFKAKVGELSNWTFTAESSVAEDYYSGTTIAWSNNTVTLTFETGKTLPKKVAFSADLAIKAENGGGTKKFNASSNVASVVKRGDSGETITNTVDMTLAEDADLGVNNANEQIKGYQTDLLNTYAIDVYFDDSAVYCYNRGTYNPDTAKYEVEQGDTDSKSDNYAEKDFSATKVNEKNIYDVTLDAEKKLSGKWFGFDGSQNLIVIVNRSNAGIKCKTTSSVDDNVFDTATSNAKISLFKGEVKGNDWYTSIGLKANSDATSDTDGATAWKLSDFSEGGIFEDKLKKGMAPEARKNNNLRFGNQTEIVENAEPTTCAGTNANGGIPGVLSFYYNVTGSPKTTLSSTGDGKFTSTKAEKIGTISLAFTAA